MNRYTVFMKSFFGKRIIGYFGEHTTQNLGDVAVFKVMSQHKIWNQLHTLVDFRRGVNWERFRSDVNKSSAILIGGGTQISALNQPFFDIIQAHGKPISTFGTGVGSCGFSEETVVDLKGLVPFLKEIENLTVRGPLALSELRKYGLNHARVVGDPALGYAQASSISASTKRVCVNLTFPILQDEFSVYTALFSKFSAFLRKLASERWIIDFIALHESDTSVIRKFVSDYDIPCNHVFYIYEDPMEYLQVVASAVFVLGVRLHSAVLSACAGVPFLLVNYRPKCYDFVSSIGRIDSLINPQDISVEGLVDRKEWIVERGNELRDEILDSVNFYKSIQFEFLNQRFQGD